MKLPNSLSDEKLIEYSEIVAHEIDGLHWTASVLHRFRSSENGIAHVTGEVYLQAFAMHARNLIGFLYLRTSKGGEYPTDVVIQDYVDPENLTPVLPTITPLLENAKYKADKRIAHLTLTRLEVGMFSKGWLFTEIYRDIMVAFNQIEPLVSRANTGEHFRAVIKPSYPKMYQIHLDEFSDLGRQLRGITLSVEVPNSAV